jgi:uncharacterized protein YkwD
MVKRDLLMRKISFFVPFLIFFYLLGSSQIWSNNNPKDTWQQATDALAANELDQALSLFRKILLDCQISDNLPGQVDALEAIALVYKKQEKYSSARFYCRKALNTGIPTFRSYYLLAQIEFELHKDIDAALNLCSDGLSKFPRNRKLREYHQKMIGYKNRETFLADFNFRKTPGKTPRVRSFSLIEQEIVNEMNLARQKPSAYIRYLKKLKSYYHEDLLKIPGKTPVRTHEGVKAVDEAIRFLKSVKPVPVLKLSEGLSRAARDHVNDQSQSGKTGHIGRDESKPYERIERYGTWEGLSGENIAYGDESARMIVMQLIIDDGVPDRGHRENIFNPEFSYTGVAVGTHPVYRNMCVINYAGKFIELGEKKE